jgi:adenosine deaminase
MDEKALTAITRTAIEAAFVDRKTRTALLARLSAPAR